MRNKILFGLLLSFFLISFVYAQWTENLNEDLYLYHNFEEISGNITDLINGRNGTVGGTLNRGISGVVGNAINCSGTGWIENNLQNRVDFN